MIATHEPLTMEIDMKNDKHPPALVASKSDRMKALLARAGGVGAVAVVVAVAAGPKIPIGMGD